MTVLADEVPGTHPTVSAGCGSFCTFNSDTVISTILAMVVTLALGLVIASRLRDGRPGKLQMVFELFLDYVRRLVRTTVSDDADFIVPLAATIGFFILVANWLDFFPLQKPVQPATADLNLTLAMALVVFLTSQAYSIRVLGLRRYLRRLTKPFELPIAVRIIFIPLNVIEDLVKPITLSLRLFGNIFAGLVMIFLLTQLPFVISWIPVTAWKLFDVLFIGAIQAFIFMLLTVIYFDQAREGLEEEEHEAAPLAAPGRAIKEGT